MKKLIKYGVAVGASALPYVALAQSGGFQNLDAALNTVASLIGKVIPIIIGATVLLFLWGILKFVLASGEEARTEARKFMVFGIIALAVMVSVWGLVNFLRNTVGINGSVNTPPPPPQIPGYR